MRRTLHNMNTRCFTIHRYLASFAFSIGILAIDRTALLFLRICTQRGQRHLWGPPSSSSRFVRISQYPQICPLLKLRLVCCSFYAVSNRRLHLMQLSKCDTTQDTHNKGTSVTFCTSRYTSANTNLCAASRHSYRVYHLGRHMISSLVKMHCVRAIVL